ncbi:MAG: hypothetical protein ACPGVH_03915 [Chitinophagales bacterium]
METFIKNELENLNTDFHKSIIGDLKSNTDGDIVYKDAKTYQDVFKERKAILPIQNLFGYFIFGKKWQIITEKDIVTPKKKMNIYFLITTGISALAITLFLFWFLNGTKQKTATKPYLEKQIVQIKEIETTKNPKVLIGSVSDVQNKKIASVDLFFKDFNKKFTSNKEGYYSINDSLIIYNISKNKLVEVFLSHKNYIDIKYLINENNIVFNDTISSLLMYKKAKPTQGGTQININEVINQTNGTINIGPTTINK